MDLNKFTQKSLQAVQDCQKLAYQYGNQKIEQEHLLLSLLTQEDSLIDRLLAKMGINHEGFKVQATKLVEKLVKVSGGQVYVGDNLNRTLVRAEEEAKQMVNISLLSTFSWHCLRQPTVISRHYSGILK